MKNKKLKYGSFAVVLTIAVLAVVIIINAVFTAFVSKKSLYIDMTNEQLYSVSDAANDIFSQIQNKKIEIIFFTEFDKMNDNEQQKLVYEYSKKLADKYDYVSLRYIDSITNPDEVKPYLSSSVPKILTTDVVITDGNSFRRLSLDRFFTFDSETKAMFAFNAEYRFATAFMQLSYDSLLACFTVGHGETTSSSDMKILFEDAGFEVKDVDLSKEEIPDNARILIINNPIYDFTGAYDEVNEIKKVDSFLDNTGSLMVFSEPGRCSALTNLNEFLTEWGIEFTPAQIKDYDNSISSDGLSIVADYPTEGSGSGFSDDLRELENPPKTIVQNASPINILWGQHNSINVSPVLLSKDSARAYSISDNSVVLSGSMNLMTLSVKETVSENNEKSYKYVLACGTPNFTNEKYLNGNTYANSDIIFQVMRAFGKDYGKDVVPIDLDFKVFDDRSLDITLSEANTVTVLLSVLMPVIVLGIGVAVWARRRHL